MMTLKTTLACATNLRSDYYYYFLRSYGMIWFRTSWFSFVLECWMFLVFLWSTFSLISLDVNPGSLNFILHLKWCWRVLVIVTIPLSSIKQNTARSLCAVETRLNSHKIQPIASCNSDPITTNFFWHIFFCKNKPRAPTKKWILQWENL